MLGMCFYYRGKSSGSSDLVDVQALNLPLFKRKIARIQNNEGFVRTPPNRYGPSSSLSYSMLCKLGTPEPLYTRAHHIVHRLLGIC